MNFKIANIVLDRGWLELARERASELLERDPELELEDNRELRSFLQAQQGKTAWSRIS